MKQIRVIGLLLVMLLLGMIFSGGTLAQDVPYYEDDTVLIGFVIDESGVGATFADSQLKGLALALEDLNANGGILGKPVAFIKQDAELNAEKGATIARQFITEDQVDFLLGPTSSSVALAVTEVAREEKRVVAFHTSNSYQLTTTHAHPYMVQVMPHTNMMARSVAGYVADLGYTNWAWIGPDYAFGRDTFDAFVPALQALNPDAQIVSEQWAPLGTADLTPYMSAIQTSGADAIFTNVWGSMGVEFVLTANDYGMFEQMMVAGMFDTDLMKAIGDQLPDGQIGYGRAPFYGIDTDEVRAFVTRYYETYEVYPSDWAILVYDAVMALAAAAEAAGTTEADAVALALNDLSFASLRGELTVRACDHLADAGHYVGRTQYSEEYGFPILVDVEFTPAEEMWYTCEEVEAFRQQP
ncbi:MAG: ABC transporter substrate-binding protein [Phototrophicaceae bacterium]